MQQLGCRTLGVDVISLKKTCKRIAIFVLGFADLMLLSRLFDVRVKTGEIIEYYKALFSRKKDVSRASKLALRYWVTNGLPQLEAMSDTQASLEKYSLAKNARNAYRYVIVSLLTYQSVERFERAKAALFDFDSECVGVVMDKIMASIGIDLAYLASNNFDSRALSQEFSAPF